MDPFDVITYKDKYTLPITTTPAFIEEVKDMECREDDIVIVTYPKSGTHWMQEIVQLILVDGHLEQLSSDHRLLVIELSNAASRTPKAVCEAGPVLRQVKNATSPRVLTTHVQTNLLPRQVEEKGCKVIYVVRHPKDVMISLYHFIRRIVIGAGHSCEDTPELFERFFDKFIAGKYMYGSWSEHVSDYYKQRHNGNYFFTTFEAMISDTKQMIVDVAAFIGRKLSEEAIERILHGVSLETMRQSYQQVQAKNKQLAKSEFDANAFINKGAVGQWKDRLTPDQNERFNEMLGTKIKDCELTKSYSSEE